MGWFKVLADGSEIDIIHASSSDEAIAFAKLRHDPLGEDTMTVWSTRPYGR